MTEMAALQMKVDTSSLVKAANDLDAFSKAATRAGTAGGNQSGSIAKMVAVLTSMDAKLSAVVGNLEKLAAVEAKVGTAAKVAANDINSFGGTMNATSMALSTAANKATTVSVSFGSVARAAQDANAHVAAYQAHLATMASRQEQSNSHMLLYAQHLNTTATNANKATTAIKFTAQEGLNASRQLADIGVTAAMGMSPLMIALQQGPQLFDILQNKAVMTGTTIGAVFRSAAVAVAGMLAPLAPLVVVLGAAAAGLAALNREANKDSGLKKYTTQMGYTKAEVEKLNAVTVTYGDTAKAVLQVGMERIAGAFGVSTDWMSKKWASFLSWMEQVTRNTITGVYTLVAGAAKSLGTLWDQVKSGNFNLDDYKKNIKDAYKDSQTFIDEVIDRARKNARDRQDKLAETLYNAPASKKGGANSAKDAFSFADLMGDADKIERDLKDAAAAIGLYGEALDRLQYKQQLMNKAADEGLKLSDKERAAIEEKAAALAKLAEANRLAQWREDTKKNILDRSEAIKQEAAAIGVQGVELRALRIEQELLNDARSKNINLTDNDREKIKSSADILAQQEYNTVTRPKAADDNARYHAEQMRQLEAERNAIYLTGKALIEYEYQQELINKQLAAGVALKDIDIEKTNRQAAAYANVRYAVDQQKQGLAEAREVAKGFLTDTFNGLRQGENAFKAFGNAAVNALNKIIDKLMNKVFDGLLDSLFDGKSFKLFADGGTFGTPQKFAKGGAFTNTIVTQPTPFMFANGGSFGSSLGLMGESDPEAVMPLKRGPNGSLGVEVHGGSAKPSLRMGDITQVFHIEGAMTSEDVVSMVRQGSAAAVEQTRRDLQSMLEQLDADGKLQ